MRKLIGFTVLSVLVLSVAGMALSAGTEKKEKPSCFFHMDSIKDAKYEVTNTANGVTISITSDKPEVVKQIQEAISQCREAHKSGNHKTMCPMKNGSKAPCHTEQQEEKKK